ncbi:ATP-dependent zinc protease [Vibrio sp. S4M6]|uniref:ATP-dependent zinc protease family protein n=1 Tax=Vibrio sinus TaxID=2946865 RepID=UPI00202AAAA5|nr:ATP-dependent zinc protease [Vibrio sinus]MCL9782392.1 ATP-dependent zinc protease [Vibrio sinus]
MYKSLAPVIIVSLLSGCTVMNGEQYHQENLQAIKASENNVNNKISALNLQMRKQANQISVLQTEVKTLTSDFKAYQKKEEKRRSASTAQPSTEQPIAAVKSENNEAPTKKLTLGELEQVHIDSIDKNVTARIDTGAATSSLNAVDIQEFERNSQQWVRFHLFDGKSPIDEKNWIEAPVLKHVKVRQATVSKAQRRAVIELWIKVGPIHEKVQFNLADRTQMKYPVLLGREFIRDIAVVDVSRQFLQTEKK